MYDESGVYVLRAADTQNYKIGTSSNVERRISDWRRSIPFLKLEDVAVYYTSSARKLEGALHRHFAKYRIHNTEWFELSPEQAEFFNHSKEKLVERFGIDEDEYELTADDEDSEPPDDNIDNTHDDTPNAHLVSPEPAPKKPERLTRLPDYRELAPDERPSIQDEFDYGLLPEILELYDRLGTWAAVGTHYGVDKIVAYNVAINEIMPLDNILRRKFGLCMTYPDINEPIPDDIE